MSKFVKEKIFSLYLYAANFYKSDLSSLIGGYDTNGAWTFGPTTGANSQFNATDRLTINTPNTTAACQLVTTHNGVYKGIVGTQGTTDASIITGYNVDYAMCLVGVGGLGFSGNGGTTLHASATTAGSWTWGPTTGSDHQFNATDRIIINTPNTTAACFLQTQHNGSAKGFIGTQGTTDASLITGYAADYAMCVVGTGGIGFSADAGAALHGSVTTTGEWTLGKPTSSKHTIQMTDANFALEVDTHHGSDPYGPVFKFTAAAPNNATNTFVYCGDTVGQKAAIRSNGGFANFQANDANLSDRRQKQDIVDAAPQLPFIKQLRIREYRYIGQQERQVGIIAQELQAINPDLVGEFGGSAVDPVDGTVYHPLSIRDGGFVYKLAKALQEQQAIIESLEARITDLESRP